MGRRNVRSFLLGISLAWLSSFLHAKGPDQYLDVFDFSKGLDSYHGTTSLPDGTVQDALNGYFDDKAPFTKRAGYTVAWSTKTYAFTSAWTYVDNTNTFWQIVRSSDQITASNLAGSVVKVSTVSSNDTVGFAAAFGSAYFVDPTQGVYYWNGTSTSYVANSPHGSIISQFHNRLWVSGAAVPNGNQLYGSKYYDGTTWTTGLNATDPVQYSIGLNDNFDVVTALYVYLDTLYTFKKFSIFTLTGFDQTNFNINQITQECGCIDTNSIQTYNGGLKLVSLRGVENFDGYHCTRISDPIKNLVDPAIQSGAFSQQSWVQSTQADWQAGSFNPTPNLSATIASPNLTVSSFSITNSFSASVQTEVSNNSFEIQGSGDSSTAQNWTYGSALRTQNVNFTHCGVLAPKDGSWYSDDSIGTSAGTFQIINANTSAVIASASIASNVQTCTWTPVTVTGTAASGVSVKAQILHSGASITSDAFTANGNNLTVYFVSDNAGSGWVTAYDFVTGSPISASTGTTSSVYDTGFTSSVAQIQASPSGVSVSSYTLYTSTASNGVFASVLTSSGTNSFINRYVKYVTTYTYTSAGTVTDSVTVLARSTGTFTSQCHALSGISTFGNLSVSQDLTGGGNIAYSVCSSPNSNCSASSCKLITANSQITVSTNSYGSFIASFTVLAATEQPKLVSATIQWFSGTRATPMASTVWDNRYWLALTTTTADSANDAVLVLNRFNVWTKLSIHAGGFTQYKNSLYHSDSLASGNVYLDGQGFADNGSAIDAYVKTKDFSLGDISRDSYLYAIYPSLDNLGSCSVSFGYYPDRISTAYNLGSPTQTEFATSASVRLPIPLDSSHQDFGRTFNFKIDSNDASCGLQLYGFRGIYKARPNN